MLKPHWDPETSAYFHQAHGASSSQKIPTTCCLHQNAVASSYHFSLDNVTGCYVLFYNKTVIRYPARMWETYFQVPWTLTSQNIPITKRATLSWGPFDTCTIDFVPVCRNGLRIYWARERARARECTRKNMTPKLNAERAHLVGRPALLPRCSSILPNNGNG